jgi:hypothetical protein
MIARRLSRSVPAGVILLTALWACSESTKDRGEYLELTGDVGGGQDPTSSSSSTGGGGTTSSSTGGAGGAGGGVGGAGGAGGAGGGCPADANEPNDLETVATNLGVLTDCDDTGGTIAGVLSTESDADWFVYTATDDVGCTVGPGRTLTLAGAARLCKYAECASGTIITCLDGSVVATSPDGHPGCCHTQGFTMDIDCDGVDDDATVYIRVDTPAAACTSYTLDYHY